MESGENARPTGDPVYSYLTLYYTAREYSPCMVSCDAVLRYIQPFLTRTTHRASMRRYGRWLFCADSCLFRLEERSASSDLAPALDPVSAHRSVQRLDPPTLPVSADLRLHLFRLRYQTSWKHLVHARLRRHCPRSRAPVGPVLSLAAL